MKNAANFPSVDAQVVNMINGKIIDGSIRTIIGVDIRLHFSTWPRLWQKIASWLSARNQGGGRSCS